MQSQCVQVEMEYREWKIAPLWYLVKTTLHRNGKVEAEIVKDESGKVPVVIQDADKPADGVWETPTSTIYYTYHQGYKEAARQVELAKMM